MAKFAKLSTFSNVLLCALGVVTLAGCAGREQVRISIAEGSWEHPIANAKVSLQPGIAWIGSSTESGVTDVNGTIVLRPTITEGLVLGIGIDYDRSYSLGIGSINRLPVEFETSLIPNGGGPLELLVRIVRVEKQAAVIKLSPQNHRDSQRKALE
jgi:hypothetical protein